MKNNQRRRNEDREALNTQSWHLGQEVIVLTR